MTKTVIITGGNKGIGFSITKKFVQNNFNVFVGARSYNLDLKKLGSKVTFVKIDAQKETEHERLAKKAIKLSGNIDVYINNVGLSKWLPINRINKKNLDLIIKTNLYSTFWGCKVAYKYMKKNGSIINISSIAGKRGSKNNSAYSASKFGVNGLTQSLSKEFGLRNIRVNAICPVLVKTKGLIKALYETSSPAKDNPKKFIDKFRIENAALNHLPTTSEVADLCYYLGSENSSAITGQCINIDCGVFPQ